MHRAPVRLWRVGLCAWLALSLLTACSPPPELAGRSTTPTTVSARSLMPDGQVDDVAAAGAVDTAAVRTASGGRLAALRFATADAAQRALADWRDRPGLQVDGQSRQSVEAGALRFARYAGAQGHGLAWVSGTWLFTAEAPDGLALAALIGASGAGGPDAVGWGASPPAVAALLLLGVGVATGAMILMGRRLLRRLAVPPAAGLSPLSRDALLQRLLALNAPDRPWLVRPDEKADLVVEWKFADAAWWGILAKSGVRKTYRLRLYLDEPGHRCRALDELGEIDWSAGLLGSPRVTFQQSFFRGVQLLRKERGAAYGFQTATLGNPGKTLDYAFDIDALKRPVIEAVTGAGWSYQPALWPTRGRRLAR